MLRLPTKGIPLTVIAGVSSCSRMKPALLLSSSTVIV